MKTSESIAFTIERLPKGYVFTYADFNIEVERKEAVIKALNRMAASGKLVKVAKGKYYKPENSIFGSSKKVGELKKLLASVSPDAINNYLHFS